MHDKNKNPQISARIGSVPNVEWRLTGADGKVKQLFQENLLGAWLVRSGNLSPLWINRWYSALIGPFLGHYADRKIVSNKIVNAGLALTAALINGNGSPAAAIYVAVGIGSTAVAATDVALQTELASSGLTRAAGTPSQTTTSVSNDTSVVTKSFSVSGGQAVTEAGLFNASSGTTMLCRQTFTAVNVVSGDTLQIIWKIQATSLN